MAVLNIVTGSMLLNQYKNFFDGKDNIIFDESFCVGEIPLNIFRSKSDEAYKKRIEEINKFYDVDCAEQYYRYLERIDNYDFSQVSQIHLYFGTDMFCQINLLALIYYLEMRRSKEELSFDITINLVDEQGNYSSIRDALIEKRYLTKQDIDDLVMAFIYLIHNQNAKRNEETIKQITQRINSFTYMRNAIDNYFFVKTDEFKEKCERKFSESDAEYVNRMLTGNRELGLSNLYYLTLSKN